MTEPESKDRELIGFLVVCDVYRGNRRVKTREAAERMLARIEAQGACQLPHRIEEVYE